MSMAPITKKEYKDLKEYYDYQRKIQYNRERCEKMAEEFEAATQEVEEQLSAEEETNEAEVEEAFAAEQKAEEVSESVEDKTVVFDAITPEKMDIINNFFNRK